MTRDTGIEHNDSTAGVALALGMRFRRELRLRAGDIIIHNIYGHTILWAVSEPAHISVTKAGTSGARRDTLDLGKETRSLTVLSSCSAS